MSGVPERLTAALADRYRLERELGQGGMATVYLAEDLRHGRQVAIKVLHEDLGAALGADRFLAEIKTTARLQHPHILPLLDSGSAQGPDRASPYLYYVMPYVAGETLRARLERERQLPLEDALRIAREVADALGAAHGLDIIHRDIKPENILLQGGHALVADFGIALAVQQAGSQRMTQTGLSLGTPQYMSPEQAMGERTIDARSDLYALGAVTYEMLTGEPPFSGATVQAVVAKVLAAEPERPTLLRKMIPPHVEAAVLRALAKLPADRWGSAAEFAAALSQPGYITTGYMPSTPSGGPSREATRLRRLLAGAVGMAIIAGTVAGWYATRGPSEPALPLIRVAMDVPGAETIVGQSQMLAISPDGTLLARSMLGSGGEWNPVVQRLAGGQLTSFDRSAFGTLALSPSGLLLAAFDVRAGVLWSAPTEGGPSRAIMSVTQVSGFYWLTDTSLVLSSQGSLLAVVPGSARADTLLFREDGSPGWVHPYPVNDDLILVVRTPTLGGGDIQRLGTIGVFSRRTGQFTELGLTGARPAFVLPDLVTFLHDGSIWAVRVDPRSLMPRGSPQVIVANDASGEVVTYAVARNGVMVARRGSSSVLRELLLVGRDGNARPARQEHTAYRSVRFSPDGTRLLYSRAVIASAGGDLFVLALSSGALLRLTSDSANLAPEWSQDGRSVYFATLANRTRRPVEIMRVPATGGGMPEPVFSRDQDQAGQIYEFQVSPGAEELLWREDRSGIGRNIYAARLEPGAEVRSLRVSQFDERGLALSPDGEWYLYASDETGISEIYVARLAGDGARWPVSVGGGLEPRWARNGEIFYFTGDSLMATRLTLGETPQAAPPRLLFRGEFVRTRHESLWDVSPDGRQFAFARAVGADRSALELVLHWASQVPAAPR